MAIPLDSLEKLRDIYEANCSKHVVIFSTIQTFLKRFQKFPELVERFQLFALSNDWEHDGAFFATVSL